MFEQAKRKNEKLKKEIGSLPAENKQLKDRLFAAALYSPASNLLIIRFFRVGFNGEIGKTGFRWKPFVHWHCKPQ
jgi:hypothetical protein